MSDRTSASIFGEIFEMLAEKPTKEHKKIAKRIFEKINNDDFNYYQMGADEALITLGLAHRGPDLECGGETIVYYG